MANVRKKGKRKYQFWLGPTHREMLDRICEEEGLNMVDTVRELLAFYYKVKGLKLNETTNKETKTIKAKIKK